MNILITGGSRGIGKELVLKFAQDCTNHIVVLSRNQKKLDELRLMCAEKYNNQIITYSVDFLEHDIEKQVANILDQLGMHFHIVINNAGWLINKPFNDTAVIDWEQSLKVNLLAPALIIKNTIKLNDPKEKCHIINIASMGGVQGSVKFPGLTSYSASKAALINLTECLAEELKESNTSINVLALGAVQTEMLEEAFPGYKANTSSQQMAEFIYEFSVYNGVLFNGKVIPVSNSTP